MAKNLRKTPPSRPDVRFVCELPAATGGWRMALIDGDTLICVAPGFAPRIVHPDGTVEIVTGNTE